AALLSAVTPMVVKLRLASLAETGRVVGRLSGIATFGALVATFATGFLLVVAMPTSMILFILGALLVVAGIVLTILLRGAGASLLLVAAAAAGGWASVSTAAPCDMETAYHCARVVQDPTRQSGRILQLDTLWHSYVDLGDPTYLQFAYIRAFASVLEATSEPGTPLRGLHLGGGGVTFPRYIEATRPGSQNLVLEIDPGVVALDTARLGLEESEDLRVEVRDARVGLAAEPAGSRDLVVGDAFGGLAVPWHLTTRETVEDIRRVVRPGGVYMVNVIDYPPLEFARAELATIRQVFPHVALIAEPDVLSGEDGGNLVIVASDERLPTPSVREELQERAPELEMLSEPSQLRAFAGRAVILTDDYAPVDQIFTPYPSF
ncbi:MAG: fused MFS/spermidine synthase, partial [Actinomycetota bacterium]|nr:fused MFS/spermidine synthase [Actinomycetota bacterium]